MILQTKWIKIQKNVFGSLVTFKNKTKKETNNIDLTRDTAGLYMALTCKCRNGWKIYVPREKKNWGEKKAKEQVRILKSMWGM